MNFKCVEGSALSYFLEYDSKSTFTYQYELKWCCHSHWLTQALMTDETIGNVPILILGNKIDRPEAISEEKLREIFGLYGQTTGKVRHRPSEPRL